MPNENVESCTPCKDFDETMKLVLAGYSILAVSDHIDCENEVYARLQYNNCHHNELKIKEN